MRTILFRTTVAIGIVMASPSTTFGQQRDYHIVPVGFTDVRITDDFWSRRIEVNRTVTIPYALRMCEETGRVDNFAIAGGQKQGQQCGIYPFDDTDVYKIIEGASYSLRSHPDSLLAKYLDELIAKIGAAQEKDGYLYTARTNKAKHLLGWTGETRWSNLSRSHELYNAGHLYESAVAHYLATGKRTLLDIALKNAGLIASVFGPDKKRSPPGHEEIEIGLVKLYRVTGDAKYLQLAKFFLEERGQPHDGRQLWGEYAQDHKPVLEQEEAVGHAVRELYMCSGIADVAALTGDQNFVNTVDRLWKNIVGKKLYVTGGVGAQGFGESFGPNYDLPNMSAYCETCAQIANVLFNHRMFLLHGDGKYIDVMERTLYNALLAGISLSGDRFFYPNPLASRGQHERSPWFECACCPSNVTRFIPSVPGYVYAYTRDSLFINLFVSSEATIPLGRTTVRLHQETRYPWSGTVRLMIDPEQPARFALLVRIPGWARNEPVPGDLYKYLDEDREGIVLKVNGEAVAPHTEKGFACLERTWKEGDTVELEFPMPVRRVVAHNSVADDAGKIALQRGPVVCAAEWPDYKDGHVFDLVVPDTMRLHAGFRADLLNGVEVIRGNAYSAGSGEKRFVAIPYYAWAHRGPGEMAVWLAKDKTKARAVSGPSIPSTSRVSSSGGSNAESLKDEREPGGSHDLSRPCFRWSRAGDTAWVQYEFPELLEVSEVQVYWCDDGGKGDCHIPKSWRILARVGGQWEPVWSAQRWGVEKDTFNKVILETARTDALRLEAVLQPGATGGVLAWRVY